MWKSQFFNKLTSEIKFICHMFFVISKLGPAHIQRKVTVQQNQYQDVGIIKSQLRNHQTPSVHLKTYSNHGKGQNEAKIQKVPVRKKHT